MSSLVVMGSPISQPTRAVMWLCRLLNLQFEFKAVDSNKGEHISPEFLKLNPNGKFPVLLDGDFVLFESHAILRYLARKYKNQNTAYLYPEDNLAQCGKIDSWLDWKHTALRPGAAGIVRRRVMSKLMKDYSKHSMRFDLKEVPESREARILTGALDIMEQQLSQSTFLTGEKATLADIACSCEIEQLLMLPNTESPPFGCDLSVKYPKLHSWQSKMRQIEGFEKTHKALHGAVKSIEKMRAKSKI
mmetsp:Transcript_4774/g.5896  ORF Transcript_4774/g.5896 Transcript_4774/m.5896 type:complete len:246 (-) Transcript_4774:136-873(-)